MENAGGEHGAGAADQCAVRQVLQVAHSTGGNHWYRYGIRDGTREIEVEARLRAVPVHARKQELAGSVFGHLAGPLHCVDAGGTATAMRVYLPAERFALSRYASCVDRHNDALRTMVVRGLAHEFGVGDGGTVHGHLVGTRVEQTLHIAYLPDATAHRAGDEDLAGHRLDRSEERRVGKECRNRCAPFDIKKQTSLRCDN